MQIDRINGLTGSVAVKIPCKAATQVNITLSGTQTVDGVALVAGDRCLVRSQTIASENGIYDVSATAWSRSKDFNGVRDVTKGTTVRVTDGTVSGQLNYEVTNESPVIGTSDIDFLLVATPATTSTYMATLLDDETVMAANSTLSVKGADIASAAELTLGTDGTYFDVTGTTTITSIASIGAGNVSIKLHFDSALTLTYHATDLILPGGANITTAAGDEAEFVEYATGDWRCTNYQRATSVAPALSTKVIDIGDWNMDTTNTLDAPHGLDDYNRVRSVSVLIRNDTDTRSYSLEIPNNSTPAGTVTVTDTNVSMNRLGGGFFDGALFDSISYNRGWITIQYTD
jgi:hypothetical protein